MVLSSILKIILRLIFLTNLSNMKNRYDDNIREANQLILDLTPGNVDLRLMLAFELAEKLKGKSDYKIIELGCGEGDLTKYLFKIIPDIQLEALDISPEMLSSAKENLKGHADQIVFIESDAEDFLEKGGDNTYDFILSAWTIHNFPWTEKEKVFRRIFASLKTGGTMLLMDKVYVDDPIETQLSYDMQMKRYQKLGDAVRDDMLKHEVQDFSLDYRMSETQTKEVLGKIGFKDFEVIDRVGRDVVISVTK